MQGPLQGLGGGHLAMDFRGLVAFHQGRVERDHFAALLGDAVERLRQAGGGQVVALDAGFGAGIGQGAPQGGNGQGDGDG
ncbi:MAG: hypothetical protein GAK45_01224 [Pseudomonas citronellolis]|nr:MAG: hypothetical protein GAK45_01224 [Pseudomonas citronellolis]